MGNNLVEDDLFLITSGGLELLLDETGAVLITTKLDDISEDIPQFPLASFVCTEILQERASKGDRIIPPPRAYALRESMRTIETVHPGHKETDGGTIVQGVALSMRRWGRSHRRRIHHRLELSLLISNTCWESGAQHRGVASIHYGLRGVVKLRRWGPRRGTVIIEHSRLWTVELWRVHCLRPNPRV